MVHQHFETVFHCCAVAKSYFWKPEFYPLPLPEMDFHCCTVTKSYFWKPEFYCLSLPVDYKDHVTLFYYVYIDPKLSSV